MEQPFTDCCDAGSEAGRYASRCVVVDADIQMSVIGILVVEYAELRDDVTEWCRKQREVVRVTSLAELEP